MDFSGKRVLVTGATAGIGEATAAAFVAAGAHVVAAGRRQDRLDRLVQAWNQPAHDGGRNSRDGSGGSGGSAEPLVLDVTDHDAVAVLEGTDAVDVDILVGNAGLARGKGPLQIGDYADWKQMVDTNILGLLDVFRACVPALTQRRGHVVNLGSVAGRYVYPGGNVYSASKFAVRALTEAMRLDLQGTGIRVTNISPGAVDTEFSLVRYKGDEKKAAKVYEGYEPLHAQDIADAILWSCSRPAHVNIQELVVYPTAQAGVGHVVKDR